MTSSCNINQLRGRHYWACAVSLATLKQNRIWARRAVFLQEAVFESSNHLLKKHPWNKQPSLTAAAAAALLASRRHNTVKKTRNAKENLFNSCSRSFRRLREKHTQCGRHQVHLCNLTVHLLMETTWNLLRFYWRQIRSVFEVPMNQPVECHSLQLGTRILISSHSVERTLRLSHEASRSDSARTERKSREDDSDTVPRWVCCWVWLLASQSWVSKQSR